MTESFVETNALIDVMGEDYKEARRKVLSLMRGERIFLADACHKLADMCNENRDAPTIDLDA